MAGTGPPPGDRGVVVPGGLRPIGAIDLFHHGEVIASALDLLGGGTPFRTFFWSHGLSDTGVAALLIGLTGNRGLGTIVLLHAINAALLVATLYVLARGLIRDPLAACLAATLLAATVSYPIIISRLPGSLIAMLAFAVLSRGAGRWGLVATGALLGFGYLWRIDAGAYALAATILFLGCDRYSALGGSLRDQVLNPRWAAGLLGDVAALLAGAASLLLVMRLVAGFPTVDWFRTTLIEMPRHVRDSGGFPLPLPWRGVALSWDVDALRRLVGLPAVLLLGLGMFAFTLLKAAERRLPLGTPRDRFFLLLLLYSLFSFKTILTRSDWQHTAYGSLVFLLVAFFDGLEFVRRRCPLRWAVPAIALGCLALAAFFRTCFLPVSEGWVASPGRGASRRCGQPPLDQHSWGDDRASLGPGGWRRLAWGRAGQGSTRRSRRGGEAAPCLS